jgi:hypothetical protein
MAQACVEIVSPRSRWSRSPPRPGIVLVLLIGYLLVSQLFGYGPLTGHVCTTVPANGLPYGRRPPVLGVLGLARGSQIDLNSVLLCAAHPGTALRPAGLLAALPSALVLVIFLLRLRRLLLEAGRPGVLFSPAMAARLRWLGWFLIAGSLAASVVEAAAQTVIFLSVVHFPGLDWFEPQLWHLSVAYLLLGLALISAAGVMRAAMSRRDEETATI